MTTTEAVSKAKPVSVWINRGEGPIASCGKPLTVATFLQANHILSLWAQTAPAGGGYDKCDFRVAYDNGDTYSGRIDLVRDDFMRSRLLEKHMVETTTFYAGRRCPAHLTEEKYRAFLSREDMKEACQEYAAFLDTCQIGDIAGDYP